MSLPQQTSASTASTASTATSIDYSYLLGPSHPLWTSADAHGHHAHAQNGLMNTSTSTNTNTNTNTCRSQVTTLSSPSEVPFDCQHAPKSVTIPILELDGVVLFPNASLPIRIRDPALKEYLGRQIQECRLSPHKSKPVQLGIVTHVPPSRWPPSAQDQFQDRARHGPSSSLTARILQQRQRLGTTPIGRGQRTSTSTSLHQELSSNLSDQEISTRPRHRLVGRVGTLATIMSTHNDSIMDAQHHDNVATSQQGDQVWQNRGANNTHHTINDILVTAVGTNRFTVVKAFPQQSFAGLQLFTVEPFGRQANVPPNSRIRTSILGPSLLSYPMHSSTSMPSHSRSSSDRQKMQERLSWNMFMRTSLPFIAYKRRSYWLPSLMQKIMDIAPTGTCNDKDDVGKPNNLLDDPDTFAFWMASNLPFSEDEKLELLGTSTVADRLELLLKKVIELKESSKSICCKNCDLRLAAISDIFTVGGCESSSTGNYVNGSGFIHQIMTVRRLHEADDLEDELVVFSGAASSENSYFPGYTWTIASCRRCYSFVGWKFLPEDIGAHRVTLNEPASFYAFMSSNIAVS